MRWRPSCQLDPFMQTLAGAEEEGEKKDTEEEPGGDRHSEDDTAVFESQEKESGDTKDVDKWHVAQLKGIKERQEKIAQEKCLFGRGLCQRQGDEEQHKEGNDDHDATETDLSCCDGSLTFTRMEPILSAIKVVIADINAA